MSLQELLDFPADFRRPLNGLCRIKYDNEDVFAAWYDNNVLLSPVNVRANVCKSLKINDSVRWVFQNQNFLHCVDTSGTIFTLSSDKNEDDVDVFESSVDDDCKNLVTGQSFTPSIVVKNIVCISPLRCGFILLKYNFGKLYVELYGSVTNDNEIKKSTGVELCTGHDMLTKHCTLRVFQADKMTQDFCQEFVKILGGKDADIVFIGLPNGYVYSVVVSSNDCVFLARPALIYSCPYSVVDIVPIHGTEDNLFSKVGIVLSCGTVVLVSYDNASRSLSYKVCNLPSYPRVVLDTKDSFIYGDGLDLWHCTLNRSISSIDCNLLTIKGVCFVTKYLGDNNILAATVHNTFYWITLKGSSSVQNVKEIPTCSNSICEMTESLYRELQQIELYKKEVNCEENLISAVSIFSRHMFYEKYFRGVISVESVNSMSIENYLSNYCQSKNFDEILTGNKSLSNFYLINITVENKSESEFSPLLWSFVTSVTVGGVTTQKCNKLLRSFTIGSSLSSSLILCIEQPFLGASVNISLVQQLLEDNASSTSPWLIVPLIEKELDVTCFLKNYVAEMKNKDLFMENILRFAQKSNTFVLPFENSNIFEPCYDYEFYVPSNVNELWLIIQQLCSCDQNTNSLSIGNKFAASVGALEIKFVLSDQRIKITSRCSLLLSAVKEAIIERWTRRSDSAPTIPLQESVVARAVLYKEKMQIEKMTHSKVEFETFKNVWRHFMSEYLSV